MDPHATDITMHALMLSKREHENRTINDTHLVQEPSCPVSVRWAKVPLGIHPTLQRAKGMPRVLATFHDPSFVRTAHEFLSMFPERSFTTLQGHTGAIHCALWSNDGNYCMTGSADRSIKLWNPLTKTLIKTYVGHGKEVLGIQLPLGDSSKFVSCSGDRSLYLWDVATGKTIQRYTDHTQRVNACDFNKDATVIVSGSYDATVRLWDCRSNTKRAIQKLEEAKDSVESVMINDYEIITGSVDGFTRMYDIRTGTVVHDDVGPPITHVTLSNDKNCVLVASMDDKIRLLDKETGELLAEYQGHTNSEYRIRPCFTNTDSHVIGGSEDGRVLIWDLVEGTIVKTISAHSKVVTCIRYHPTTHSMITTSFDGTAKLWIQ
jgi:mitogen-activated protein kinase organizer 1